MNNTSSTADESLSVTELRNFGLILSGGIVAFLGLLFPLLRDRGIQLMSWPWILACILVIISLVAPGILGPVNRVWLLIGHVLGYINTRIILGIIFILIFTPVAFLLKALNKDPMRRSLDAQLDSYRIASNQPKPENLNRPY
jgi:hypothetical protein